MSAERRMVVHWHGANWLSRWLYRHALTRPLGWLYYRLVRAFLTHYHVSEDGGRTWRRLRDRTGRP